MEDQEELKSLENMRINNLKLTKQNLIVRPKMSEAPKEEIKPYYEAVIRSYKEELSKVKGENARLDQENVLLKQENWNVNVELGKLLMFRHPKELSSELEETREKIGNMQKMIGWLDANIEEKDSLLSKQGEEIKELLDFVRSASLGLFTTRHVQKIADQVYSKYRPSTPSPEKEK